MRIAVAIPSLKGGGAERAATTLSAKLADHGHDVTLIAGEPPEGDAYQVDSRVQRHKLRAAISWGGSPGIILDRARHIRHHLRDFGADVCISQLHGTNAANVLANAGRRTRTVVLEVNDPRYRGISHRADISRRILYRRADAVVALNHSMGRWILDSFGVPPTVIRYYLPLQAIADPPAPFRPDGAHFVAVGRLHQQKGFDTLLRAFHRVAATHQGARLTIAGEGRERNALAELVSELGLNDKVVMPGFVDVARLYRHADAFVLSSRYEGLGLVVAEAMASGLPAIVTNCLSGPSELVAHGRSGQIVPVDDIDALVAAMTHYVEAPQTRHAHALAALDIRDEFNDERITAAWLDLLNRITGDTTNAHSGGRARGSSTG